MSTVEPGFPREIASRIFWINQCMGASYQGGEYHLHLSLFLLVGDDATLLVDTSTPSLWPQVEKQLETALGGRTLDYIFVTHPEVPHSSALPRWLTKYPEAKVVGDMRDYDLYFPDFIGRFHHQKVGDKIDLGGLELEFLEAHLKDLPGTLWAYEASRQVMFVCDGFAFTHRGDQITAIGGSIDPDDEEDDDPLHLPGECSLLSSELSGSVDVDKATYILRRALYWSRFVDADKLFERVEEQLRLHPAKIIAPSHGNVIDNLAVVGPVIRESHVQAYRATMSGGSV